MKRLVLLGGGHAHLRVMAGLAARPLAGWEVWLVTPSATQIYSGMLPGWIAGHYELEQCSIDLAACAVGAGVTFIEGECVEVETKGRSLTLADGRELAFDVLSIDVGSAPDPRFDAHPGESVAPVRPLHRLVESWQHVLQELGSHCGRFDLVVLGGGAGSLELAFAARHRAMRDGWSQLHVTLAGAEPHPWAQAPSGAQQKIQGLLVQRCIDWQGGRLATGIEGGRLAFDHGDPLRFDACWLATGPAAPGWPTASGLETDEQGFVRVGPTLQCIGHPAIFATGDVAALADPRPKSGVYAVRAGPALARNLRAWCTGQTLTAWRPQSHALYLLSTGDRSAIAVWGRWWWQGRWVWRWKDRIDRRFVESYRMPPKTVVQERSWS